MQFIWLSSSETSELPDPFRTGTGVRILRAASSQALPRMLASGSVSALIVEVPDDSARASALRTLEDWCPHLPVWILEPAATVAAGVQWIKAGAAHLATTTGEIETLIASLASETAPQPTRGLVSRSHIMAAIEQRIQMVADRRCTVLIEGETGTGKEVVARAIHAAGSRSRGPWVAVNCGAIPEALLEAELFGSVKGAFTGSVQPRAGKFEAANRGTIFLDEIGDMPLAVQGKLLRVLQEREVVRLGGNEPVRLDVRVIAATNASLADCVRRGTFRQDLYYRLNVFSLSLPPLRERPEDIPALAAHFVSRVCAAERLPLKVLDPAAVEKLLLHNWPGNVRELENTLEAAVISSGPRAAIFPADISWPRTSDFRREAEPVPGAVLPADGLDYERVIEDFEKNLLAQALARTRGNKTAAANLLGMKRTTLAARMRALESRLPRLVA